MSARSRYENVVQILTRSVVRTPFFQTDFSQKFHKMHSGKLQRMQSAQRKDHSDFWRTHITRKCSTLQTVEPSDKTELAESSL